jgi:hypothetical protein
VVSRPKVSSYPDGSTSPGNLECVSVLVKCGLENRDYGRRGSPHWSCDTPLIAKVGTNFADIGGHSVGIVRSQTKATELVS